MLTAMTRFKVATVKQSCFKMKRDVDAMISDKNVVSQDDHLDVGILLEKLGLSDIEYEEVTPSEWRFPETVSSEISTRHLSGGGLVTKTCETSAVQTISQSPEEFPSLCTNPFKNANMRLVLEADQVLEDLEQEIDDNFVFSSTNPFCKLDLRKREEKRTLSQCSTRAVSPSTSGMNPFQSQLAAAMRMTISQATQTGELTDLERHNVEASKKALGACGWYHGNVSWQDSIILLQGTEPGTFFVRDSADPNFLFSLSLQTAGGPTSVRLHQSNGLFRLDSEPRLVPTIPSFESVIELIEYYIVKSEKSLRKSKRSKGKVTKEQVWVDIKGQMYSNILLTKPLCKTGEVLSLKHLCRLHVNETLKKTVKLSQHFKD